MAQPTPEGPWAQVADEEIERSLAALDPRPAGASAAPAAPRIAQAVQAPSPAATPGTRWYLALRGEAAGPMALERVQSLWSAGEIDEATLCWCEGYEQWRPLFRAPELAHGIAAPGAVLEALANEPVTAVEEDGGARAALLQLAQEEVAVQPSAPSPAATSARARRPLPPAAVGIPQDEPVSGWMMVVGVGVGALLALSGFALALLLTHPLPFR